MRKSGQDSQGCLLDLASDEVVMVGREWHLVAYDVRDDSRLRRVARILEGYGTRVQYSVFRCRLSQREVERLRWELSKVLERDDALLIASLCPRCVARIRARGPINGWTDEDPLFEIIGSGVKDVGVLPR